MRYVAFLVIAASLVIGVIGAMTAYLPRIDTPEAASDLSGLHLNAPAGARPGPGGEPEPIVADEAELTSDAIAQLQAADVKRVRVREFSFGRWTGWWMYLIACAGLLVAGFYLRFTSRARATVGAFGAAQLDPRSALARMRQEVEELIKAADQRAPRASMELGYYGQGFINLVVERIGELQKTVMPAFIEARTSLVAASGMAGYAHLMDAYATAERAMNRAWSAAADNDEIEALASLERALVLLDETAKRLPGTAFRPEQPVL